MDPANIPVRPVSGCLSDEQITELVEGLASGEKKERYLLHLSTCSACASFADAVGAARSRAPGEEGAGGQAGELDDLPRGARVGRYEILERIGAGGMGTVYAAHDPALDRRVALKLIRAQVAGPELEARLLREAKAIARVSHPEVIAVHDAGRDGDRLYIAMELVEGGTLRQWLDERPRTWRDVVAVYVRAGQGLAQAHASGLIHRDFKPDNVLIGKDGRVRVTDFGLARDAGAEDDPRPPVEEEEPLGLAFEETAHAPLTRPGALVGTPVYMPPEQLAGVAVDARSDVYAFCVALYEALYGERPFGGKTVQSQRQQKEAGVIDPAPQDGERRVPARVRRVLLVGLRAKPEDRYASMGDLLRALEYAAQWPLVALRRPAAWAGIAALGLAVAGGAATWLARERGAPVASVPGKDSRAVAVAALAGPNAPLACPIFETRGVADVGPRLGAAAATLACLRLRWSLGGSDERVLVPAALLDLPRQPVDALPDPYAADDARPRTVAAAKARAAAYVDGTVTNDRDAWTVEIVVRAPDDREVARSRGADSSFISAVRRALEGAWAQPLVRRPIDPDVARWTSFPDADIGTMVTDLLMLDSTAGCETLGTRAPPLEGSLLFYLDTACKGFGARGVADAGVPRLDESSPAAMVTSAIVLAQMSSIPIEDARRLVAKLEGLREKERSGFGRARIAYVEAFLWRLMNEHERAETATLLSLREDPLVSDVWDMAVRPRGAVLSPSAAAVASAWLPSEANYIANADSWRADELRVRLRDAQLAYLLDPEFVRALHLGRALAEAGRADDARALTIAPLASPEQNQTLRSFILGLIDLHDVKIESAIAHLEDAGDVGMVDLAVAAEVAGRGDAVATRWAERFLSRSEKDVESTARGYDTPMLFCMRARGDLAARCLDRVSHLGHSGMNWWYEGGAALLNGARRYASGDLRGAVSAWRPLVAASNVEILCALPTEAFERAGEPELAARLDARKMAFHLVGGVSEAAPREARRAFERGDTARAKELARAVMGAWDVADVDVAAVGSMRALLKAAER